MDIDSRLNLWQYTEIKPLGRRAVLIRNNMDGRFMVKCVYDKDNFEVFSKISKLGNPNLMRVYDTVISDEKCVSICEYIEGVTLEHAVETNRLFSEIEVRNITAQLCDGLASLHQCGIVHRDITPSNIMLTPNNSVKIIDYDIVRTIKNGQNTDTQVLGTPGFAAPEQFGFTQTDERADIYSCGVLMNYLLTGKLPNEKLYFGNLTPIIQKCVEMDSENRYRSVEELKQETLGLKFYKRNKIAKKYINYSRLPGFRGKGFFLKFLTVVLMIAYFVFAFAYINYTVSLWGRISFPVKHFLTGIDFLFLLSALPYFTLGDVGGLSRFIVKGKPQTGRMIFRIIGYSSLLLGVVLFVLIVKLG